MSVYGDEGYEESTEREIAPLTPVERRSLLTSRVSWKSALAVMLAVVVLRLWVVESVIVDGASMSRTLLPNEWVLVLKLLRPDRFSIIVFIDPQEDTTAIKRVIGLPGDVISRLPNTPEGNVRPGTPILINGRSYREPFARYPGPGIIPETTVAEDSYYVAGDNRGDSVDSRRYGPITRDRVRGVAVAVVYPFSKMRMITPEAGLEVPEAASPP